MTLSGSGQCSATPFETKLKLQIIQMMRLPFINQNFSANFFEKVALQHSNKCSRVLYILIQNMPSHKCLILYNYCSIRPLHCQQCVAILAYYIFLSMGVLKEFIAIFKIFGLIYWTQRSKIQFWKYSTFSLTKEDILSIYCSPLNIYPISYSTLNCIRVHPLIEDFR